MSPPFMLSPEAEPLRKGPELTSSRAENLFEFIN